MAKLAFGTDGQSAYTPTRPFYLTINQSNTTTFTSSDAVVWVPQSNNLPSAVWLGIDYCNDRFIAYSNTATAAMSTNGVAWTSTTNPISSQTKQAIFANGTYVLAGNSSSTTIATSTDAITWTARTLPAVASWAGVAFGNNRFVTVSGSSLIGAISTDAITWTQTTTVITGFQKVHFGAGDVFIAQGGGATTYQRSTDGTSWTSYTTPISAIGWWNFAVSPSLIIGVSGSSVGSAIVSTDGITWTTYTLPSGARGSAGTYISKSGTFVWVANSGGGTFLTTNGITWTTGSGVTGNINGVAGAVLSESFIPLSSSALSSLSDVTGPIQASINTRAPLASPTFTGSVTSPNITINGFITLGGTAGTAGQVIQSNGGSTPTWVTPYTAPRLGSTTIASNTTVSTVTGLGIQNLTLTGTLTANSSTGTNGQVLQSTGTGVQWASGASTATPSAAGVVFGSTTNNLFSVTSYGSGAATAGDRSVAIGYLAAGNGAGTWGTFIGARAGASNTGNGNLFIGYNAGSSITTSGFNMAIGNSAGQNVTTGSGNSVLIGNSAMSQTGNTAFGANNVLIGFGVQNNGNNPGDHNTLVGAGAYVSAAANNSVAIGSQTSGGGNGNVTVGAWSNNVLSTGTNNTSIGYRAGVGSGAFSANYLTTGSNNVFLGADSAAASGTASNVITLGNASITTLRCQVTTITALSDQRDKKNIVDIPVGLDFIKSIRPVVFEWDIRKVYDEEGNEIPNANNGTRNGGFIAQELDQAQQDFDIEDWLQIVYKENPDKLEASIGKLLPIIVKSIQDLSDKVEGLEAQLRG